MTIPTGIDKRTGRAYGDHGTALQAIQYVMTYQRFEADTFLKCWLEGNLDEWPEFYTWLAKQPEVSGTKAESTWQPIETAPQDGSKFLFIEASDRIQVGRMDAEWGGEKSVFVCLTGGEGDWYPSIRPTHWVPLPAPPKQEA